MQRLHRGPDPAGDPNHRVDALRPKGGGCLPPPREVSSQAATQTLATRSPEGLRLLEIDDSPHMLTSCLDDAIHFTSPTIADDNRQRIRFSKSDNLWLEYHKLTKVEHCGQHPVSQGSWQGTTQRSDFSAGFGRHFGVTLFRCRPWRLLLGQKENADQVDRRLPINIAGA